MPYIHVTMAVGRTLSERQGLMKALAKAAEECLGVRSTSVRVWVTEVPVEDMSVGGVPLDEVRRRRAGGDQTL